MTTQTLAAPSHTLRVTRVVSAGEFSALHAGEQIIVLRAIPSVAAAQNAARLLSQVALVHIDIAEGDASATLHGIDHRLPVERHCSLAAALAYASAEVPTVITTDHTLGEGDPR